MRLFLAAVLLMTMVLFSAARGEERIALVVANPVYDGAAAIANAEMSAELVATCLRSLGFTVRQVTDGDRADVARAMYDFAKSLSAADSVGVFYYVGHTAQANDRNYLLTRGARTDSKEAVDQTALPLDLFVQALEATPTLKVIVLDNPGDGHNPTPGVMQGLAAVDPLSHAIVALSAKPGSVALNEARPVTVFADALTAALTRRGVGIRTILASVRQSVFDRTFGTQWPWVAYGRSADTDFVLTPDQPVATAPAPTEAPPEAAAPEPAPPPMGADGSGYDSPPSGYDLGGGYDGSDYDSGSFNGSSQGSGNPDEASTGNGVDEAAAYEEYKRQEQQRQQYEEQLRAEAEALRAEAERAAHAAGGEPILPPAPPPDPVSPVATEVEVVRHPTIDAPAKIVVGETATVSIALTEERLTPEVKVKAAPGSTVTADGALAMAMPAGAEQWPIDIDLFATGFDLADGSKWSRQTTLYRQGDSDVVRFDLKARPIAEDSKPGQFIARIYSAGRFLGSASRPVTIERPQPPAPAVEAAAGTAPVMLLAAAPPQQPAVTGSVKLGATSADNVPDLDVTILYDDPSGLGPGQIIIHSPHLAGPVTDTFSTPPEMSVWLDAEYHRLLQLGLSLRGAVSLQQPAASGDPEERKLFVMLTAEGFGDVLYRNYVPKAFKDVYWLLRDNGKLHSIQITSNSPTLPWELVRPQREDGATSDGFLGMNYRLARWAPRSTSSQADNPLDRMAFTGVAAVAPSYVDKQSLPFQEVEIAALSKLAGYRRFDGDFVSFERLVGEVSTGFIHFSGHGEVNQPSSGRPVFAIDLVDQSLDPDTWRALVTAAHGKGNPFYFFNACDTGKSQMLGGFVQGWGPAVLAGGASGFIGGMWPLTDRAAAAFSSDFYGGITGRLKNGPVYLADVLAAVRKRFYETGDPTYLAYTFYGNANLQVVTQ
jgi:hypothetical protein